MVCVVKNGGDTEIAIFSDIQQSEEHASEKRRCNTAIGEGFRDIGVVDIRVEGIELRRDAFRTFKPFITSSDGIGDCSPPFIGSSTVGKYNYVSPPIIVISLQEGCT